VDLESGTDDCFGDLGMRQRLLHRGIKLWRAPLAKSLLEKAGHSRAQRGAEGCAMPKIEFRPITWHLPGSHG
jgi:hypothetical protein